MKVIVFYNEYSAKELDLKNRIEADCLPVAFIDAMSDESSPFRQWIGATPAYVIITDDMQGEFLLKEGVDPITLIRATLVEAQAKEELNVHGQNNDRLDVLVNAEKQLAADQIMADLSDMGVL